MIHLPGQPGFQSVALAGDLLVMAHPGNDSVYVFDIAKRRIVAQVENMQGVAGVVIDEKAGKAYVANRAAEEIAVLNTRDWQVEQRIALKTAPRSLLLAPEAGKLYSANWHHRSLSVVNLEDGSARTVDIEGSPEHLAFDAERRQLFATLQDVKQVAVLSPELEELKRFPVEGSQPTGIAFDRNQQRLYVAVRHAIVALDPDTGEELGRSAAPAGVDALQLKGERLYAVASGGVVLIYRSSSRGLIAEHEVPTEVRGHALAYHAGRNLILLPGGSNGRAKLLLLQHVPTGEGTTEVSASQAR